jgi:hypothetical protein
MLCDARFQCRFCFLRSQTFQSQLNEVAVLVVWVAVTQWAVDIPWEARPAVPVSLLAPEE